VKRKRAKYPTPSELAIIAASLTGGQIMSWQPLYYITKAHELWICADMYLAGLEKETAKK